jgi:hypothetical protein
MLQKYNAGRVGKQQITYRVMIGSWPASGYLLGGWISDVRI